MYLANASLLNIKPILHFHKPTGTIVIFVRFASNVLNLPYIFSAQKICDFIVKTFDQH